MSSRQNLFVERLILFLMPYFCTLTADHAAARAEIIESLESFGARTRSELLITAKIIAFGFSALDMLAESKAIHEMPLPLRLRYRGCANGLDRSCQQNEKALAKHLACDEPNAAEPANDISENDMEESLQQAKAVIDSYRNRLSGARPATTPHAVQTSRPNRNKVWTTAMMDGLIQQAASTT